MERHQRRLDGEGGGKGQEEPGLCRTVQLRVQQRRQIKRVRAARRLLVEVAEGNDASQHQEAAHRGVEDELESGIDASLSAPRTDQQVGRNEHQFPENVEQEEIGGEENAENAAFQQQHEGHVVLDLLLDAERGRDTHSRQQAGEDDEQQADAIHAQAVVDANAGNPAQKLVKLERAVGGSARNGNGGGDVSLRVEQHQRQGKDEIEDGEAQGHPAQQAVLLPRDRKSTRLNSSH